MSFRNDTCFRLLGDQVHYYEIGFYSKQSQFSRNETKHTVGAVQLVVEMFLMTAAGLNSFYHGLQFNYF